MGPISRNTGVGGIAGTRQPQADVQKTGPSKFDRLRADLSQKLADVAQLPPKVTNISDQQKEVLKNDLRKKLASGANAQGIFAGDLNQLRSGITDINRQIAAIPNTSAFAPLRERLQSIESDYNASAKLLDSPGALDDPKHLLEMQMQVYKLSENVEILSRTVSEVASTAKTVLQTQV